MGANSAERERRLDAAANADAAADGPRVPLRVVIAGDSDLACAGLSSVLARAPEIEVVAVCEASHSLLEAIDRDSSDGVLDDIGSRPLGQREEVSIAAHLRRTRPELGVVVGQHADPGAAVESSERPEGRAHSLKDRLGYRSQPAGTIQAVSDRPSGADRDGIEGPIKVPAQSPAPALDELTTREREVLAEVATGKSNTAIACLLCLSKRSVEKHINAIFMKLNLRETGETSRRVKAALMFIADRNPPSTPSRS